MDRRSKVLVGWATILLIAVGFLVSRGVHIGTAEPPSLLGDVDLKECRYLRLTGVKGHLLRREQTCPFIQPRSSTSIFIWQPHDESR
jgi:hypothetical protein